MDPRQQQTDELTHKLTLWAELCTACNTSLSLKTEHEACNEVIAHTHAAPQENELAHDKLQALNNELATYIVLIIDISTLLTQSEQSTGTHTHVYKTHNMR